METTLDAFADIAPQNEDGRQPSLHVPIVRGLVRSLPWVLLLVLLGLVTGIGVGLLQPNRYVSTAKLFLRMGAREQLTSESLVDFEERHRVPLPTMVDELQMLSDVAIFERVALELGPLRVLTPAAAARDDGALTPLPIRLMHQLQDYALSRAADFKPEQQLDVLRLATKTLRESTVVTNEPGSSVILISHTATSPELARSTCQALADAFIARHRRQFSIKSLLESSRDQLEEARRTRDEAVRVYVEQASQSGIAQLETQVPRLEIELASLENELFSARVRGEEISRLRTSLANRLEGVPDEVELLRPSVMVPNEEYETQLTLKRMLLAQKQEMLIQNRPSEEMRRQEREFDNQIARIDRKLKETPKAIAQGAEQEILGDSAMETRIVDLEVEDEALSVKLGLVESRLETKKADLIEIQKQLLTATMLRRDVASARDAEEARYTHLLQRFSALEALDEIDVSEEASLRVLQVPTLEHEKVGPMRGSLALKGLLVGIVAAIAFAVLRQRFERRLRYPEVFERSRGVPVLGVVPHLSSLRRLRRRTLIGRG